MDIPNKILVVLKKNPIAGSQLIKNKFERMILDFDGSMTKLIQNLSGEKVKLDTMQELKNQLSSENKKVLSSFFANDQNFLSSVNLLKSDSVPYLRTVMMQTQSSEKPLVYARSFWNPKTYQRIMQKNPNIPIGLNLINQKISPFRQLNWIGLANIQINDRQIIENIKCRSYTMTFSDGQLGCLLEQYFTDEFFELFVK